MNFVRLNNLPTVFDLVREFAVQEEGARAVSPPVDILENDKAFELSLDLPGVNPDAIEVKVDENVLTVTVERKAESEKKFLRRERHFGTFSRSFTLPNTIDSNKLDSTYRNGVLTLSLTKKEEVQPKTFKVRVSA